MSYLHGDKVDFRVPDGKGGGKTIRINKAIMQKVQSRVKTHEGQTLNGKSARDYMDKHSKKQLGKDLSGVYKKDL